MISFSGDTFLVTGGYSGIGASISQTIHKLGAKVIILGRNKDKFEKFAGDDLYYFYQSDLNDFDSLPSIIDDIISTHGKIKGFIHSAGISKTVNFESKKNNFLEIFNVNLFSSMKIIQHLVSKKYFDKTDPSITFISSIASVRGFPGAATYASSKGAINSLVRSLAIELANRKIRVNAVLPGYVETDMLNELKMLYGQEYIDGLNKKYPLGIGKPEDVANLVAFIISPLAKWMTGSCIVIDGGGSL